MRLLSLLLALTLITLAAAAPAPAADFGVPNLPIPFLEEEEEEMTEAEESEWCAEEPEACKEGEAEEAQAAVREECPLRSAHAHAALARNGKTLKLTIGYTTYEPFKARIEVGHIATLNRHLGRSGVLRIVKGLRKNQRLKRLVVRIGAPSSPSYCKKLQTTKVPVH